MKSFSFDKQVVVGLCIGLVLFLLGTMTYQSICYNLAWVVFGAMFVINPVYPDRFKDRPKAKTEARLAGVICIVIGLVAQFGL